MPAHAGRDPGKDKAIVSGEIARALRQGFAAQIGWRRDHDPPGDADFSGDQRVIGDLAAANRKIDAFLDQVDLGVVHRKIDADVGIARQKFLQMWNHAQAAEYHGHREPQRAGGARAPPSYGILRFAYRLDRQFGAFIEAAAVVG